MKLHHPQVFVEENGTKILDYISIIPAKSDISQRLKYPG